MDLDVLGLASNSFALKIACDIALADPTPLTQLEFDEYYVLVSQAASTTSDYYTNRGGSSMDPPHPGFLTAASSRLAEAISDLESYATANSLTY